MKRARFLSFAVVIALSSWSLQNVHAGKPAPEQFFADQRVDHLAEDAATTTWSQRFYIWDEHFAGPGSPIFLILGGEGGIPPEVGLHYPFVTDYLARDFGGYVLQPEHRFYGKSQPLTAINNHTTKLDEDPRVRLFTPEQALHDAMYLLERTQLQLGCSLDRHSSQYCPVVTVGGSYPGWLSAMARLVFPHKVDMAYAASAPMKFYSQEVDQSAYYNHITKVADETFAGCADAVRETLEAVGQRIRKQDFLLSMLGICPGSLPDYMDTGSDQGLAAFVDELVMVIGYTFANQNMANYPPGNTTSLYKSCLVFSDADNGPFERLREFLVGALPASESNMEDHSCWSIKKQLPTGPKATISSGDWSGVGTGSDGESWDFQTCTLLVEAIGFSKESMFLPRDWSLDWLTRHCQNRFGVQPEPFNLVRRWRFDAAGLLATNASRILFTNGNKDGWSVGGFSENLSDSLLVLNFPNGAHHSDLSGVGPTDRDSADIQQGFQTITEILRTWLDGLSPEEQGNSIAS